MKRMNKFFALLSMLIAGLSFKGADATKMVVADAAEIGSYAYLNSRWKTEITTALSVQGFSDISLIKNLLITNDGSRVPTNGYLNGCPVEVGLTDAEHTPTNYTNGCAVAAYVYPNATDITMYDCVLYADVETIYPNNGTNLFSQMYMLRKITFDCNLSMANAADKSMSDMFNSCEYLQSIEGLEKINTTNVTDMSYMFSFCSSLETIDVSHFDTLKVTNMSNMFEYCSSLSTLDVSSFDTSNVTDMSYIFHGLYLSELDVSSFNTMNVTNMSYMFSGVGPLRTLDISSFNTTNVTNMSGMFSETYDLRVIVGFEKLDTTNVADMSNMFSGSSTQTIDVSWMDTTNVTNMNHMFSQCKYLTTIIGLEKLNTANVTDMSSMFYMCERLLNVNVSNFDTSKVMNLDFMFYDCHCLTTLDLSSFDFQSVTSGTSNFLSQTNYLTEIKVPKNLNGHAIKLNYTFGMTTFGMREIDPSMEGWTLLKGSKEFNVLHNNLTNLKTCDDYMQAPELQAAYDGLNAADKTSFSTLRDHDGVLLTEKLTYMVYLAKANTAPAAETYMAISPIAGQYLVIVIACLSLAMIGGYYFLQKKKYAK